MRNATSFRITAVSILMATQAGQAGAQTLTRPLDGLGAQANGSSFFRAPDLNMSVGELGIHILPGVTSPARITATSTSFQPTATPWLGNWGVQSTLDITGYRATPIRFEFSQPLASINFSYFDQGGDDDGPVRIKAYAPSGQLVNEFLRPYGTSSGGRSGDLDAAGATAFTLETVGALNPNSLDWSIASLTVAPLAGLGQVFGYPLDQASTGRGSSLSVNLPGLDIGISATSDQASVVSIDKPVLTGASQWLGAMGVNAQIDSNWYRALPVKFDFSRPVTSIKFAYFDQGGDDDGNVIIKAFDASGAQMREFVRPYGTAFGSDSGDLLLDGASAFTLETTGAGNINSLSWSIASVTVRGVPEPGTLLLQAMGLGALFASQVARRKGARTT